MNKAGRWDIALFGFDAPDLSEKGMHYACQNMTAWNAQLDAHQVPYDPNGYTSRIDVTTGQPGFADGRRYRIDLSEMMTFACEAGLRSATQAVMCGYRESLSSRVGPDNCLNGAAPDRWPAIPAAAQFPADTTLRQLRGERGAVSATPDIAATPCHSTTGRATVINVQSFTSLRNGPSPQHQRIAELPLGTRYAIKNDPSADFRHPRHDECKSLCKAAEFGQDHDAAALRTCIDTNWLWFRIEGVTQYGGYASAKYLDY